MTTNSTTPKQITLGQAKASYLTTLNASWSQLHDDAEADFEAGFNAGLDSTAAPFLLALGDARVTFSETVARDPLSDLRLDDFTAGFKAARPTALPSDNLKLAAPDTALQPPQHAGQLPQAPSFSSRALQEVARERATHAARGWTTEHDAEHGVHHLVYLAQDRLWDRNGQTDRAALIKAASLLIAAIDVLDRQEAGSGGGAGFVYNGAQKLREAAAEIPGDMGLLELGFDTAAEWLVNRAENMLTTPTPNQSTSNTGAHPHTDTP